MEAGHDNNNKSTLQISHKGSMQAQKWNLISKIESGLQDRLLFCGLLQLTTIKNKLWMQTGIRKLRRQLYAYWFGS